MKKWGRPASAASEEPRAAGTVARGREDVNGAVGSAVAPPRGSWPAEGWRRSVTEGAEIVPLPGHSGTEPGPGAGDAADAPDDTSGTPSAGAPGGADLASGFGRRVERLIAAAVAEAEQTRHDAESEAARLLEGALGEAERVAAQARRRAAEVERDVQERAAAQLEAAGATRRAAESELADAREEAERILARTRQSAAAMRAAIDEHAQSMLARTRAETEQALALARAELDDLSTRRAELEDHLARLRGLLALTQSAPAEPSAQLRTTSEAR